jgi:glycosyltransferase involved in cell wall biosynthesis
MAKISAIIHAHNDEQRLARALDSLRPCDEVLVIDHDSSDRTAEVAREHGAKVKAYVPGVQPGAYVCDLRHDWVLCLQPDEALSEALEASLFEWKQNDAPEDAVGYSVVLREETENGWRSAGRQLRLANRCRINWSGALPPRDGDGHLLAGDLLRFSKP